MFVGLTNEQKEGKLVNMVTEGDITAYLAVYIAMQEGLDVDS